MFSTFINEIPFVSFFMLLGRIALPMTSNLLSSISSFNSTVATCRSLLYFCSFHPRFPGGSYLPFILSVPLISLFLVDNSVLGIFFFAWSSLDYVSIPYSNSCSTLLLKQLLESSQNKWWKKKGKWLGESI